MLVQRNNRLLKKYVLWGVLCGLFPPLLLLILIKAIIRPAFTGKVPQGISYFLWILGLIFIGTFSQVPVGSIEQISKALESTTFSAQFLTIDVFFIIIGLSLILFTFRAHGLPNPYLPLKRFKFDSLFIMLSPIAFLPLSTLLVTDFWTSDPGAIAHPLIIAFFKSFESGSHLGIVAGILSIGVLGPIFEEFIFRGLLLEHSHELKRRKIIRYVLDFLVCIFFAVIHLPVSFVFPFIFSALMIFLRRRTHSLIPSIILHCIWNCSLLASILLSSSNI